jgi:hypothetical protein
VPHSCSHFFQVCTLLERLGDVLWRLWLLAVVTSTEYASVMVLSSITVSCLLLWTCHSMVHLYFTLSYRTMCTACVFKGLWFIIISIIFLLLLLVLLMSFLISGHTLFSTCMASWREQGRLYVYLYHSLLFCILRHPLTVDLDAWFPAQYSGMTTSLPQNLFLTWTILRRSFGQRLKFIARCV